VEEAVIVGGGARRDEGGEPAHKAGDAKEAVRHDFS
jgi:hypothetical protein